MYFSKHFLAQSIFVSKQLLPKPCFFGTPPFFSNSFSNRGIVKNSEQRNRFVKKSKSTMKKGPKGRKMKRSVLELLQEAANGQKDHQSSKKAKIEGYHLEPEIAVLIDNDRRNVKLWTQCKEVLGEIKKVYIT